MRTTDHVCYRVLKMIWSGPARRRYSVLRSSIAWDACSLGDMLSLRRRLCQQRCALREEDERVSSRRPFRKSESSRQNCLQIGRKCQRLVAARRTAQIQTLWTVCPVIGAQPVLCMQLFPIRVRDLRTLHAHMPYNTFASDSTYACCIFGNQLRTGLS